MKEIKGNLWEEETELLCITTNGFVKKDGSAVMGAGCAKEAKELFPGIEYKLAELINTYGNVVGPIWKDEAGRVIATFPVKHNWYEDADIELIRRSALQLKEVMDTFRIERVVIPRPGCGNGGLDWETQVKPVLEEIWTDDRFQVITW